MVQLPKKILIHELASEQSRGSWEALIMVVMKCGDIGCAEIKCEDIKCEEIGCEGVRR